MEQAAREGSPVTAVYASDLPLSESSKVGVERARLSTLEALAGLAEDFPAVELRTRMVQGSVVDVLRDASRNASLLVIGRHSNSRLEFHALGHATRALLHNAPCPLMVIPPSGPFRPPLTSLLGADVPMHGDRTKSRASRRLRRHLVDDRLPTRSASGEWTPCRLQMTRLGPTRRLTSDPTRPRLQQVRTGSGSALIGVLGWRLWQFWLPIPVAGVCYLSLRIEADRPERRRTRAATNAASD